MIGDYDSETYKILSNLLGIRFAKYLKYSGIELRNIYLVKSLNSNIEFYLVEINDIQIRFRKPSDFIAHFIRLIKSNIEYYDKRYKELTSRQVDEFTDEVAFEMEYKKVDCYKMNQTELLKIMQVHYEKLKEK